VTDPVTGEPKGRRQPDGSIVPWPTRREIEESGMLQGTELVWLEDPLSAYICQVNGSARLTLRDGSTIYVGYAGKTDRPYRGLGAALVREGLVSPNRLGLPAVRDAWRREPERVRELMYENESYVFFTEYDGDSWPAGSLGVKVTARSSLATDKSIYPRGGPVLVATEAVTLSHGREDFLRFMLDQDTGGAIRAPGRADIVLGVGHDAEVLAGGQYAEGRLYYFFLKPGFVPPNSGIPPDPAGPVGSQR
jgi:membrane-bound lytic murein transglycosylase A